MSASSDPKLEAADKRLARARRTRAIRGTTAAFTVSLVIAFSATVAQKHDPGSEAASSGTSSRQPGPLHAGGAQPGSSQPEQLVTGQS